MSNIKYVLPILNLILICQGFLISCSRFESSPPISIDDGFINQQILLRAPDFSNSFKTTNPIILELKYNSNNEIVFPNNYNLRIFQRTDSEWIEIYEKPIERLPAGNVVFSPTKEMPAVEVIFLSPDLQKPGSKHQLRIYVIGDMKTNEGVKEVAAYTDVMLYP